MKYKLCYYLSTNPSIRGTRSSTALALSTYFSKANGSNRRVGEHRMLFFVTTTRKMNAMKISFIVTDLRLKLEYFHITRFQFACHHPVTVDTDYHVYANR